MYSLLVSVLAPIACLTSVIHANTVPVPVSRTPPSNASAPLLDGFVSFSIEYAFFPDYAGNLSSPNKFSNNLLNNIGAFTGTKPYIRVGGNTQDYALYNSSLKEAINGTYNLTRDADYPTTIFIGPAYFESYHTWPDTKFTYGYNLALGATTEAGWETLLETAPLACKALRGGKLLEWEYGNEPDLYSTSAQGPVRPPSWNETTYVQQWLNGTRAVKSQLEKYCPEMATKRAYGWYAPSFAGTDNHLKPLTAWADGLDVDKDIKYFTSHNYIGGANQPGVTLQKTLMNHSSTVESISKQLVVEKGLKAYTNIPFILGETNSLYNQGKSGLSNSFGAALWGVDFNLWCASNGILRTHMHQGTDYRYAAWQPIQTNKTTIGTKAPYYGNIAVAAIVGDLTRDRVQVVNLPLAEDTESAYASYRNRHLERVAVINMQEYNYTVGGLGSAVNPSPRPVKNYTFALPSEYAHAHVSVRRLIANGSDAITGVTWNGWSYNWDLDEGRPVRLHNVTIGEHVDVSQGVVTVAVPDSSAAILDFHS